MTIDYNKEAERLEAYVPSEQSDFWKPKPGQYKVKALSEIEESKPFKDKPEQPRAKIKLLVDDKHVEWTFSVGKSNASTYGQLVKLAKVKGGKLTGAEFIVVVTGVGQNVRYTIVM